MGLVTWPGLAGARSSNRQNLGFAAAFSPASLGNMSTRKRWTRDELLVALNVYHKLTFGQFDQHNPVVMAVAAKLDGRTPSSLAMKLSNFASLDPALKLRGIKGLEGASALDRSVWAEFHAHSEDVVPATEDALRRVLETPDDVEVEVIPTEGVRFSRKPPSGPTETTAEIKQRRGQAYFREAVINNFGGRCGVTQLTVRELLIASHILPWGSHPKERLNVQNGLALSRLHDAAFDRGLISFDDDLRLTLSVQLKDKLGQRAIAENFGAYAGEKLHVPDDAALPNLAFLAEHRKRIFRR